MLVLRPAHGVVVPRGGINKAIRKRQAMAGSFEDEGNIDINDAPALHHGERVKGFLLASLAVKLFEHLIDGDHRDEQVGCVFNCWCKEVGTIGVGELFDPAGGIDDIELAHRRSSSSRLMSVSIPRTKPRRSLGLRTGTNSNRPA